jgi:hypothetical protein
MRVVIRVYAPECAEFSGTENAAACRFEIVGLPEMISDVCYGADSLQALQLATDIDGILRKLSEKYDFYFLDDSPYFD